MASDNDRRKAIKQGISTSKVELKRVLARRRKIIQAIILRYTSMPNYTKSALVRDKLYNELRAEYKALNADIDKWTIRSANGQARQSWKFAIDDLPRGAMKGTFGEFSRKYMDDIIGSINPSTVDKQVAINAKIGGMLDRDIQILRQTVSQVIAQGAVEGLSGPQMSQLMLSKVAKQSVGQFQFIDRGGRKWTADNYFGMLNRTLGSTVARESYNKQVMDVGYDLAQIEGGQTMSSLTNPDDPCSRWAGKIISLTGATKGYPTYQDAINDGMFHPNCIHFTSVVIPATLEEAKAQQAREAEKGAEMRKEANEKRKDEGLKIATYAGDGGKAAIK
jgi:hypothetical protein